MEEFIDCLDRDFRAQTFEDLVSLKHPYAMANINFTFKDKTSDTPDRLVNNSLTYRITASYKNTIKWLNDHGYGGRFVQNVSEVEYIELYRYVEKENTSSQPVEYAPDQMVPASQIKSLKITDPAKIQQLLDTYESQTINFDDYYYGVIVYKGIDQTILPEHDQFLNPDQYYKEYGYNREMAEKYGVSQPAGITQQIYFNEGNIPDYVLEYFK
jgi:hypothetical protein